MKTQKIRLFDVSQLETVRPTPAEKRKWTTAFIKYCTKQYEEFGSLNGIFCCGCMNLCDLCEHKYLQGCKDCVEAIKKHYKNKGLPIPYNNYDFKEILKEIGIL